MTNFNSSKKPEYNLANNLTDEMISLYGVCVNYIDTKRIDNNKVFNDYGHYKADEDDVEEVYLLPDETSNWMGEGTMFQQYGLENLDENGWYISSKSLHKLFPDYDIQKGFSEVVGDLIYLPSGKFLEITKFIYEVEGLNNLFLYSDNKNVYKLMTKQYSFRETDEINIGDIDDQGTQENLQEYFDELLDEKQEQEDIIQEDDIIPDDGETLPDRKGNEKSKTNYHDDPFGGF